MISATDEHPATLAALGVAQCIEIAGDDARTFAQAQFSGDLRTLGTGGWQWNAWLDARGQVRALMHLADPGDGRLLALLRGGDAQTLCDALQRYVLRARVELTPLPDLYAQIGASLPLNGLRIDPTAGIGFGYDDRSLWLAPLPGRIDPDAEQGFRLAGIRAGWPTLPPTDQTFLPPALGLERLDAISFDKGCFPGQEIAARLHYRGGHKRHLYLLASRHPLLPGQSLPADQRNHGIVLDAVAVAEGYESLAVLSDEITNKNNDLGEILKVIKRFTT